MLEFILANQAFILGALSTLVVWLIWRITGKNIDKGSILAILTTILDIVQDIANNPATKDLPNFDKKKLAVEQVSAALPEKKKNLVTKVFGSVGAAVEYVYKNRKWLFSAATLLMKKVF
jgi:hypothetical protein